MTEQQRALVDAYLRTGNKTEAARQAGYSSAEANAGNIFRSRGVQHELMRRQQEARDRGPLTTEYITASIVEVVERAMNASPLRDRKGRPITVALDDVTDEKGEPIRVGVVHVFDAQNALRGLEMLGRSVGLFERGDPDRGATVADLIAAINAATGRTLRPERAPIRSEVEEAQTIDHAPTGDGA